MKIAETSVPAWRGCPIGRRHDFRAEALSMATQQWVVVVGDQHLHRIDAVVEDLEAAGLHVQQVLGILGQITGHAESAGTAEDPLRGRLAAVRGVESVAAAQQYSVGPPDAELQ